MNIELKGISKNYGEKIALRSIDLKIESGRVIGLLGPNGAGKTTLVEILEGLRLPSIGSVSVLGFDPTKQSRRLREMIGVQLQSTAVPLDLNPLETLRLFAAFFKKALQPGKVLERVGLAERAKIRNSSLSGGERQRLAIAMALINDPSLIIFDEPSNGLDPVGRRDFQTLVADLHAQGKTVLLTTHYIEEAEKLCDRIIVLRDGAVVADGSPAELRRGVPNAGKLTIALRGDFDAAPLIEAGWEVQTESNGVRTFRATHVDKALAALASLSAGQHATLLDISMDQATLEDAYLALVGPQPRTELHA